MALTGAFPLPDPLHFAVAPLFFLLLTLGLFVWGAGDYAAGIALQRVENPGEFGVVDLAADGRIRGLVEKPDDPPSDLALIGVYIFSPRVFEAIDRLTPSWRGELEITEAIQTLICDGEAVDYNVIEGWWKDTGSPAAILEANRLVLDEAGAGQRHDRMKADGATLAEGARVADSVTIEPPVSIGRNVILRDGAHVGPYVSIDDGSTVTRAQVENAVVMDDVTIRAEGTIADSLVGSNTVIDRTGDGSEESCLVVGENSYLEL
jgi:glucose-1-phosphate thymidylyltransferase